MVNLQGIRESLMGQLKAKYADIEVFREQVESYLKFTKLEDDLWEDIKTRGRVIMVISATSGKKVEKENPAIKQALYTSKQRIEILRRLGLNIDSCVTAEPDSDV